MEINKSHETLFETNETVLSASLYNKGELVALMSSGNVISYNIKERVKEYLFSTESVFSYADGGFDINSPSTIYTLDSIVVLVNDYKTHGMIYYPSNYYLQLWRKDYHADISCYPIALFKNSTGVPHIIYGEDWNHIQIMNIDTRQVLTAAKSLIEVGAEERHLNFHKNYGEHNKLAWPTPYDYFFGKLHISPNGKRFLSAGWAWGSYDLFKVYDIDLFISSSRISDLRIDNWEHENRAVCWIDDETVAVTYHPYTEDEEGAHKDSPSEVHFYGVSADSSEISKKIKVPGLDIKNLKINYSKQLNSIVAFSDTVGMAILSLDGQILFQDQNLKAASYYPETNEILTISGNTIAIYQITV